MEKEQCAEEDAQLIKEIRLREEEIREEERCLAKEKVLKLEEEEQLAEEVCVK